MRNFKVLMHYDGSSYHGFQRQENALAIQQVIEDTLEKILGQKTIIYGCSRTDTGVHAKEFCFNFFNDNSITCDGVVRSLNNLLPDDLGIKSCEEVDEDFHARYDCKAKEYEYIIHNSNIKDPFLYKRCYRYGVKIDENLMNEAGKKFIGTYDFKSFCSTHSVTSDTVRTIYDFSVRRKDDLVIIKVKGDGFLYNMVRIMVGTLIFVNEGKISADKIPSIIDAKDRTKAGKTAPSTGLFLNHVYY